MGRLKLENKMKKSWLNYLKTLATDYNKPLPKFKLICFFYWIYLISNLNHFFNNNHVTADSAQVVIVSNKSDINCCCVSWCIRNAGNNGRTIKSNSDHLLCSNYEDNYSTLKNYKRCILEFNLLYLLLTLPTTCSKF